MPRTSTEKLFACPICRKRLTTKYSRDAHVVTIHKNAGDFKCDQCGKTFRSETSLTVHLRTHTGEKPFCCKICSKRCITKSYLKAHFLDKHAEKKFRCDQCDQAFGREYMFKKHLVIHSVEKPFRCEECPKRFACKQYLQIHHRDCHEEKIFKCDQCGTSFGRNATLQKHLQRQSHNQFKHKSSFRMHSPSYYPSQRVTAGPSGSAQEPEEFGLKFRRSDGSHGSVSKYNLRARRQDLSYREDQDFAEESDEESEGRPPMNDKTITSSSEESDQDDALPSSTVTSTKLKLVFDVEYQAPE